MGCVWKDQRVLWMFLPGYAASPDSPSLQGENLSSSAAGDGQPGTIPAVVSRWWRGAMPEVDA